MTLLWPDCLPNMYDVNENGSPDECDCLPDVNGDCVVDNADVLAVFAAIGQPCIACPEDINQDGVVNNADLQIVLAWNGYLCPYQDCIEAPGRRPVGINRNVEARPDRR